MTFHTLSLPPDVEPRTMLLRKACQQQGITFNYFNPATIDVVEARQTLKPGDLWYRDVAKNVNTNIRAIEQNVITPQITTLYASFQRALSTYTDSYITSQQANLPIPQTILVTPGSRRQLAQHVKDIGGFPVILKVIGGSHGVGILKVDSIEALSSLADYLIANHNQIILRQYIDVTTSARCIVLGNKVIASIEYAAPEDDFRSNVGEFPNVTAKEFPVEVQEMAIKAVAAQELEFGGVDILTDKQGNHFIAEVNFPCNFARAQNTCQIDIASQLVSYLAQKANPVS